VKAVIASPALSKVVMLTKEWKLRVRAIEHHFLKQAVSRVYDDLLGYIPSDRGELRDSLRVDRIRGLSDNAVGYAIRSVSSPVRTTRDSKEDVVVYIATKSNLMQKAPKSTTILEEYSPWTLETLPYPPDPKTADVISRRVSRREVTKVTKARKRDLPKVRALLKESGIRAGDLRTPTKAKGGTFQKDYRSDWCMKLSLEDAK
jgi:hypothetical protein